MRPTPRAIAYQRLHNVGLARPRFDTPEEAVGWLGAVQSQDYRPATWSVAQRCAGLTTADLDRAVDEGRLIRTHVLRPTWHFVRPDDLRPWLEVTAPRVQQLNGHMYRQLGLDEATREKGADLLAEALAGGNHLTRAEAQAVLATGGIEADGLRLGYVLAHAELTARVCSGPRRGKHHTYALADERAPDNGPRGEDALAEFVRRYLASHGPATPKDLQAWSSLTLAQIRRGLELAADGIDCVEIDGLPYWFAGTTPVDSEVVAAAEAAAPTAMLLQSYDEYVMGYRESRDVVDLDGVGSTFWGQPGAFNGIVVVDGQIAGSWRPTHRTKDATVEVRLPRTPTQAVAVALEGATQDYGRFLGLATDLLVSVA
jgi:hypothetical protein